MIQKYYDSKQAADFYLKQFNIKSPSNAGAGPAAQVHHAWKVGATRKDQLIAHLRFSPNSLWEAQTQA